MAFVSQLEDQADRVKYPDQLPSIELQYFAGGAQACREPVDFSGSFRFPGWSRRWPIVSKWLRQSGAMRFKGMCNREACMYSHILALSLGHLGDLKLHKTAGESV